MELKYEVTEEDIIKSTLYSIEDSPSRKRNYIRLMYLLPIVVSLLLLILSIVTSLKGTILWVVYVILFVLLWIIRFPKSYERKIRKDMEKIKKDEGVSYFIFKTTMIIEEENIKIIIENSKNEISTIETKKHNIKKVKVYDDMILIYKDSFDPHIVPTRYLTEETKIELLEELKTE